MANNEEQQEEMEVLKAIYEEDDRFKAINDTTVQYRFGELGESKSFLLEIIWPEDYPECLPDINVDAFYNKHVKRDAKDSILDKIAHEIADSVGTAMTFTIIQWTGENFDDLMVEQPDRVEVEEDALSSNNGTNDQAKLPKERKPQLTKNQKRKIADRTNVKGERERGWDWVDIVRHLSKTGSKD